MHKQYGLWQTPAWGVWKSGTCHTNRLPTWPVSSKNPRGSVSSEISRLIMPSDPASRELSPRYTGWRTKWHRMDTRYSLRVTPVTAKVWKQPKSPSNRDWLSPLWHIHTVEYYAGEKKTSTHKQVDTQERSGRSTKWGKPRYVRACAHIQKRKPWKGRSASNRKGCRWRREGQAGGRKWARDFPLITYSFQCGILSLFYTLEIF